MLREDEPFNIIVRPVTRNWISKNLELSQLEINDPIFLNAVFRIQFEFFCLVKFKRGQRNLDKEQRTCRMVVRKIAYRSCNYRHVWFGFAKLAKVDRHLFANLEAFLKYTSQKFAD